MHWVFLVIMLFGSISSSSCGAQEISGTHPRPIDRLFSFVGDFPLGASTNRTDYQSVDPAARRLYIAKMGAGKLLVFDIDQNTLIAQLDGFAKVTGVLAVPDLQRVYASVPGAGLAPSLSVALGMIGLSTGRGAVAILDTRTLQEVARVPGGVFPDGIAYDPKERRIFVSDELGSGVVVIDALADRVVARIETGGESGNVRYDPITSRVYVPDQSHDELVAIDPAKAVVVARYALTGGQHPHGLAIAPGAALGYVACDGDNTLLTVDLTNGNILGRQTLGHDPDVLAVDPTTRRLYVASESGNLSSFDIMAAQKPVSLGDTFISEDAHSVAVDPVSHRLYFPLANVNGQTILRVLAPKNDFVR
jgi:DNA-binding beta-propeller fold protein YncE